jgi:hypothetical protein
VGGSFGTVRQSDSGCEAFWCTSALRAQSLLMHERGYNSSSKKITSALAADGTVRLSHAQPRALRVVSSRTSDRRICEAPRRHLSPMLCSLVPLF